MKETYYFQHDYNPTNDPKITCLIGNYGGLGYGIFWRIIEMLHQEDENKLPLKKYIYEAIAKQMLTTADQVETIIQSCLQEYELFQGDEEYFWSNRVNRNIEKRQEISEIRSVAGRNGANVKQMLASAKQNSASAKQNSASAKQMLASAKQSLANVSKGKERKEKEIKENIINKEINKESDPVNQVMDVIYKSFPNPQMFGNPFNRDACQKLVDNFGLEVVLEMAEFAVGPHDPKDYPLNITTPKHLLDKWPDLVKFREKIKNKDNKDDNSANMERFYKNHPEARDK